MFDKIWKIIWDPESVLVFDFDGTLIAYEFGERNHGIRDWDEAQREPGFTAKLYKNARVLEPMRDLILALDKPGRIYVVSQVSAENAEERKIKAEICAEEFRIPRKNVMFTETKEGKLDMVREVHGKYPGLPDEKIAMIDDDKSVLNYVLKNSEYTTIHASSFMGWDRSGAVSVFAGTLEPVPALNSELEKISITQLKLDRGKADKKEKSSTIAGLIASGRTVNPEKYVVRFKYHPFISADPKKELEARIWYRAFRARMDIARKDIFIFEELGKDATCWYLDGDRARRLHGFVPQV